MSLKCGHPLVIRINDGVLHVLFFISILKSRGKYAYSNFLAKMAQNMLSISFEIFQKQPKMCLAYIYIGLWLLLIDCLDVNKYEYCIASNRVPGTLFNFGGQKWDSIRIYSSNKPPGSSKKSPTSNNPPG